MISFPILPTNKFAHDAKNVYSQFGEDDIIASILELIPDKNNWCVEFGAWDGIFLSNTYNLIKNKNYRSVLIEADQEKFKELEANLSPFNAILLNQFVMFSGNNTLDKILSRTEAPFNLDFLSIDIDGNDYYILESLSLFKPKLICIEYTPTIPNEVNYVQPKECSTKIGSSALAILELARSKGYELAAVNLCNLILIDTSYWPLLNLDSNNLSDFRDDTTSRNMVFVGYDGSIHLQKPLVLNWHNGIVVNETQLQYLPKVLRKYPHDYTFLQKIMFKFFCKK